MVGKASVKIFIASSHTAETLAQKLGKALRDQKLDSVTLDPVEWWTDIPGGYILSNIERQARECDFACILFTTDTENNTSVLDNCILEAGFFAGALSDAKRCFLLRADKVHLPTDLGGVVYIPIVQADGKDLSKEEEAIKKAAGMIGTAINNDFARTGKLRAVRGLKRAMFTTDDLQQT